MTMSAHGGDDQSLPKVGDLIVGKYRIEKLIGKGGMGAVFAAQHELLGQRVAVKFLLGGHRDQPGGRPALPQRGA